MLKQRLVRFYQADKDKIPFNDWFLSLKDQLLRVRIRTRLDRIEDGNFGDYKSLGDGVFELRFHFNSGIRIYYGIDNELVVIILIGGDKASQFRDIIKAKKYWKDYKEKNNE